MTSWRSLVRKIDSSPAVQAIRQGLVMTIPLLLIGSFALILKFLPIQPYQDFLTWFLGGRLIAFFTWVNQITFGVLGLCTTISISFNYASIYSKQNAVILGAVFSALSASMIFNGMFSEGFSLTALGAQGMFTALFSGVVIPAVYCRLVVGGRFSLQLYTVGADSDFNAVISAITPATIVIVLAYLFNVLISRVFQVAGFEALFHKLALLLFQSVDSHSAQSILYVGLSGLLWFFGIHGTNVLNSVEMAIFPPGGEAGVVTKAFIDTFVLMGGCGTTISLLLAIFIFGKQKNVRSLARMAAFPMLFNINELMVYGLPLVLNTAFFIPFLFTPLVCAAIAYVAVRTGLVPPPQSIEWVTPIFFGGYQATGSFAGVLLQMVNIGAGVFIYRWFLLRYEKKSEEGFLADLDLLIAHVQEAEAETAQVALLDRPGRQGAVARLLAADLTHVLEAREGLTLFYQPQYDRLNRCIGAEALLRWDHPRCGMIYPPLLVCLAEETGQLGALERLVFEIASRDIATMQGQGVCPRKISVNATAHSLQDSSFVRFLRRLLDESPHLQDVLCIELTEQMSFLLGDAAESRLGEIRDMGIMFAVDDFSMGHTSLQYLQSNLFGVVKLDGSLIRNMVSNPRSQEIISSIVHMSRNMKFSVLAEYVETREQRSLLEQLGCPYYQGYYYSPALPLDKLVERLRQEGAALFPQQPAAAPLI